MKTPEEVRDDYVSLMGDDLGRLSHELTTEEDWLRDKWAVFRELFERGQERIDLLNRTAPNFFWSLHKLLFEDAMMHLSRLTDPPMSFGKPNLTVKRLPASISDPKLKASVEAAIDDLAKSCEFARDMRNRWLAHTDLKAARSEHPSALPAVMPEDIARALQCLRAVLLLIEEHHRMPPTLISPDWWGAEALVHRLQIADRAEAERALT